MKPPAPAEVFVNVYSDGSINASKTKEKADRLASFAHPGPAFTYRYVPAPSENVAAPLASKTSSSDSVTVTMPLATAARIGLFKFLKEAGYEPHDPRHCYASGEDPRIGDVILQTTPDGENPERTVMEVGDTWVRVSYPFTSANGLCLTRSFRLVRRAEVAPEPAPVARYASGPDGDDLVPRVGDEVTNVGVDRPVGLVVGVDERGSLLFDICQNVQCGLGTHRPSAFRLLRRAEPPKPDPKPEREVVGYRIRYGSLSVGLFHNRDAARSWLKEYDCRPWNKYARVVPVTRRKGAK